MVDAYSSLIEAFKNVGVARAYGAPVRLDDGEEFVPVALVSFGFGGGTDAEPDGGGAAGGGGGGVVLPLGVYRRGRGHGPGSKGRLAPRSNGSTPWPGVIVNHS